MTTPTAAPPTLPFPEVVIPRALEATFTRYYETRVARASAMTPVQHMAVLDEMERELYEEGRIPLLNGPVKASVTHPVAKAALEGRTVVMGGKQVTTPQARGIVPRLQAQPVWVRLLLLVSPILIFVVVCAVMVFVRGQAEATVVATETPTITVATGPVTPTATLSPEPTATPYALALTTGDAAPSANDPASIEIGGFSYVLGVGEVENGEWVPQAAEWLADTHLHRVIAVPWEPNLANAVNGLRPGMLLTVRLRSGELAKYKIAQVSRVQRPQIELLAGRTPGLSVVLYGEPNDQRTVIIATALQEAGDLSGYTAVNPLPEGTDTGTNGSESGTPTSGNDGTTPVPVTPPTGDMPALPPEPEATPTAIEGGSIQTIFVTDTLSITHPTAGIALTVLACDRMREVQGQPAPSREEYLVCEVELRNVGSAMLRFSDQAFGITERAWWESRPDWMPTVNVGVTNALGAGTFAPGDSTRGRIVGLVTRPGGGIGGRRSDAVLVWYQEQIRYVITLPSE